MFKKNLILILTILNWLNTSVIHSSHTSFLPEICKPRVYTIPRTADGERISSNSVADHDLQDRATYTVIWNPYVRICLPKAVYNARTQEFIQDNSRLSLAGDKYISRQNDGTIITIYANEIRISQHPNGTVVTEYPNGIFKYEYSNGTNVSFARDGSLVENNGAQKETILLSGTIVHEYPDRTKVTTLLNGTKIWYDSNGKEINRSHAPSEKKISE